MGHLLQPKKKHQDILRLAQNTCKYIHYIQRNKKNHSVHNINFVLFENPLEYSIFEINLMEPFKKRGFEGELDPIPC